MTQNPAAAVQMADEVACFANTPRGGAIILGVEDGSGQIIGTLLDRDWLRQRIYQLVGDREEVLGRACRIREACAQGCRTVDEIRSSLI